MRVLFICTGNIFRSMIAEHVLRAQAGAEDGVVSASAGIEASPQTMYEPVKARLIELGADPSGHVQRRLTEEILGDADVPVAMGLNHQAFVRERFGPEIPLFYRVCYGRDEPVLDLGESLPDWNEHPDRAEQYVREMVDTIWEAMPAFRQNAARFRH